MLAAWFSKRIASLFSWLKKLSKTEAQLASLITTCMVSVEPPLFWSGPSCKRLALSLRDPWVDDAPEGHGDQKGGIAADRRGKLRIADCRWRIRRVIGI